jgi:YjjG family noncanonical pyrimidine nucleotidase
VGYSTVLLDFDYTLLDSDASSRAAFRHLMAACGFDDPTEHFPVFEAINTALWRQVEEHTLTPDEVHVSRFDLLSPKVGSPLSPQEMADIYSEGMGANGELYPGAAELLDTLAGRASLAMVTNGVGAIQRARVARLDLDQYFDAIVISGEVGTAKPGSEIFDITFDLMGRPSKADVLMVGDSLSSDIRGGSEFNIDTCWYNPHGASAGSGASPTHMIKALEGLSGIVFS